MTIDKSTYTNPSFKKVNAKMYDYKCDIKLQVEKETFRAHKHILSEASDYFAAMFGSDMIESHKDSITLQDISPQGMCTQIWIVH